MDKTLSSSPVIWSLSFGREVGYTLDWLTGKQRIIHTHINYHAGHEEYFQLPSFGTDNTKVLIHIDLYSQNVTLINKTKKKTSKEADNTGKSGLP